MLLLFVVGLSILCSVDEVCPPNSEISSFSASHSGLWYKSVLLFAGWLKTLYVAIPHLATLGQHITIKVRAHQYWAKVDMQSCPHGIFSGSYVKTADLCVPKWSNKVLLHGVAFKEWLLLAEKSKSPANFTVITSRIDCLCRSTTPSVF